MTELEHWTEKGKRCLVFPTHYGFILGQLGSHGQLGNKEPHPHTEHFQERGGWEKYHTDMKCSKCPRDRGGAFCTEMKDWGGF